MRKDRNIIQLRLIVKEQTSLLYNKRRDIKPILDIPFSQLINYRRKKLMSNNLVIKNDSFIQSMHNDIQCIESLDPNDKCTSRQYWFTASMLANIFDISKDTVRRRIESLAEWGELTVAQNCVTVQMQNNAGAVNDMTLYDLQAFNKLAMDLRTPVAREIKSKFSDILVEIETTGQYNTKDMPKSLPEALRAYADAIEAKELADRECEKQRLIAEEAIRTKAQISDKKTASALGRVGGLVASNNRLKDELYGNRNRRTIKAVAIANHLKDKDISHHKLIKYCKEHNLEVIKVPDTNWNEVNSYPIEAFKAVYPELIID